MIISFSFDDFIFHIADDYVTNYFYFFILDFKAREYSVAEQVTDSYTMFDWSSSIH